MSELFAQHFELIMGLVICITVSVTSIFCAISEKNRVIDYMRAVFESNMLLIEERASKITALLDTKDDKLERAGKMNSELIQENKDLKHALRQIRKEK